VQWLRDSGKTKDNGDTYICIYILANSEFLGNGVCVYIYVLYRKKDLDGESTVLRQQTTTKQSQPNDYKKLVDNNITKSYKETNASVPNEITSKDKDIATSLKLDDRIETTSHKEPFITLKDNKPDFINKPTCRLVNPTKSEIGIVSKQILDKINKSIIQSTRFNLWRSRKYRTKTNTH